MDKDCCCLNKFADYQTQDKIHMEKGAAIAQNMTVNTTEW
jgi:hypothetical protein